MPVRRRRQLQKPSLSAGRYPPTLWNAGCPTRPLAERPLTAKTPPSRSGIKVASAAF